MAEQTSRERTGGSVLRWIAGVIVLVMAMKFLVEPTVESVQHAITRGHERAKAEIAQTQLASLSDTSAAFRLVAQSVGPSVVHIKTIRTPKPSDETASDEWSYLQPDRPRRSSLRRRLGADRGFRRLRANEQSRDRRRLEHSTQAERRPHACGNAR